MLTTLDLNDSGGKPASGTELLRAAARQLPLEAFSCFAPRPFHVSESVRKAALRLGRSDMQASALAEDVTEALMRFVDVRPADFTSWTMRHPITYVASKLRQFATACIEAEPGPDDQPLTAAEFAAIYSGAGLDLAVAA